MTTCLFVWDDDICWEENLRKELLPANIAVRGVESVERLIQQQNSFGKGDGLIVSAEQLKKNGINLKELCENLTMPVFLLASEKDVMQEIEAFASGVSDYFIREQDMRVVVARISARIVSEELSSVEGKKTVTIDESIHTVTVGDDRVVMTKLEFLVFRRLYREFGNVVSREVLYREIWSDRQSQSMRVVDTVVKRLRKLLKETQLVIVSKYKLGYLLQAEEK